MFSEIRRLFKHTSIYGLGDILGRSISFILIPLYTNRLSTSEYGVMALAYVFIGFVNVLYVMGLNTAFIRFFVAEKEGGGRKTIFSTTVFFLACTSCFASLSLLLASPVVASLLFGDSGYASYVRLMAAILLIDVLALFPLHVLRALEKSKHYAAVTVARFAVTVGLNLYFVLFLRRGVEGVLVSNLVASFFVFCVLIPVSLRYLRGTFSYPLMKKLLHFGLPLVPAVLCVLVIDLSDRYILEHLTGFEQVGVYSLGYRLGMIMTLFVAAFRFAWPPFFLSVAEREDARGIYARVLTYFLLVGAVLFLGVTLYLRILLRLFVGSQYWEASSIVPLILLSYLFYGVYVNFIVGVYIKKLTKPIPYITGLAAGVNVLFNLVLIPRFGMIGAAVATLMAYIAMAMALFAMNRRIYPVHYEWLRIVKITSATAIVFVASLLFSHSAVIVEFAVKSLLMVLVFVLLVLFRFFESDEVAVLKRILRRA